MCLYQNVRNYNAGIGEAYGDKDSTELAEMDKEAS